MSRPTVLLAVLSLGFTAGLGRAQAPDKFRIDTNRLQFDRVRFDGRVASEDSNRDEFGAYCDVLLHAKQFPTAELIAAGDRFVTYRDLVQQPGAKAYQFQPVTLELRLLKVRPFPAPKPLVEAGVPTLYECWMFPHPYKIDTPVCVLATELPPGVEPAMTYPVARPVTVGGYFFKLIQYDSQRPDPNEPGQAQVMRAPLLMARSFELAAEPPTNEPGAAWRGVFLPVVMGLLGFLALSAVGLTLYFRRGDRAVRAEIEARRSRNPFESEA